MKWIIKWIDILKNGVWDKQETQIQRIARRLRNNSELLHQHGFKDIVSTNLKDIAEELLSVSPSHERGESKKAKNTDEAWSIQETYKGKPHGWVQWKGTDVCMDIHCKCGHHSHIDDSFVYHIECPKCKTVYMVNGHVELIEIEERPEGTKTIMEDDEDF